MEELTISSQISFKMKIMSHFLIGHFMMLKLLSQRLYEYPCKGSKNCFMVLSFQYCITQDRLQTNSCSQKDKALVLHQEQNFQCSLEKKGASLLHHDQPALHDIHNTVTVYFWCFKCKHLKC